MIRVIKSICQPPLCLIWFSMPCFNVAAAEVDIGMENSIKSLEPEILKYIKKVASEASDSEKPFCTANDDVKIGPWDGEYVYGGYGGRTAGGSAITIGITVSINSPKFKQACVFQDIGIRINENY